MQGTTTAIQTMRMAAKAVRQQDQRPKRRTRRKGTMALMKKSRGAKVHQA